MNDNCVYNADIQSYNNMRTYALFGIALPFDKPNKVDFNDLLKKIYEQQKVALPTQYKQCSIDYIFQHTNCRVIFNHFLYYCHIIQYINNSLTDKWLSCFSF